MHPTLPFQKAAFIAFIGLLACLFVCISHSVQAQVSDNAYMEEYDHEYRIMPHLSWSTVELREQGNGYLPNSPLAVGFGFAIQHTFLDFKFGYGIIPLRNSEYGESRSLDFQFHNYNESWMFDLYFQNFQGFYDRVDGEIILHDEMELLQTGFETAWILNSEKFSVEAAFEQSVIQLKSAGSAVVGGGAYGFNVNSGQLKPDSSKADRINNFQLGINGGYAYSWVVNPSWTVSGMATIGANFGNEFKELEQTKIKVYPTVFTRFSTAYHTESWALAFIMIVHNKTIYPDSYPDISLTTAKLELCYVYHFDHLF